MASDTEKRENTADIWTTTSVTKSTMARAKKICPEGYVFRFWLNQVIRDTLRDIENDKQ